MFRIGLLQRALAAASRQQALPVTDEASAVEALGLQPLLVPGSMANFKVTFPEDFALAERLLSAQDR
jgi:2-C-methyl-D-erythritol 4-phosphate cytidylyltransferase